MHDIIQKSGTEWHCEPAIRGRGRDSLQAAEPPVISPDRAESLNLPAVLVFLRCMKYNGFWNETIKTEQ